MITEDFAREQADTMQRLVDSALEDVESDPDALGAVRRRALMRFQYLHKLDPAAHETHRAAATASEAANAVFARTCKAPDTIHYVLNGQSYELTVLGPNHHATPVDWLTAAWLAVITESEQRVRELCEVGKYTLRGSGVKTEDYVHPWVETVQRYLKGEPVPPKLLMSVMDLTEPDKAKYATEEFMLLIAYPPVNVLYRLLRSTEEQRAEALDQATRAHQDYWGRPEREDDPNGFVALAPRALAILGREAPRITKLR